MDCNGEWQTLKLGSFVSLKTNARVHGWLELSVEDLLFTLTEGATQRPHLWKWSRASLSGADFTEKYL